MRRSAYSLVLLLLSLLSISKEMSIIHRPDCYGFSKAVGTLDLIKMVTVLFRE